MKFSIIKNKFTEYQNKKISVKNVEKAGILNPSFLEYKMIQFFLNKNMRTNCPLCNSEYTFHNGVNFECPNCDYEWNYNDKYILLKILLK